MATSVTDRVNLSRFHAQSTRVIGIENTCICWLVELHKITSGNHAESVSHLQQIANSVKIFNDLDDLVDFATEIQNQKLFTIIPMVFIENIVPLHDLLQIDSIYILNEDKIELEKSILQHPKFKGIYTNIIDICEHLKHRANQAEQNLVSISIFSSDTLDLNTVDSSFIYSQLMKDMILETPFDQNETPLIKDFIKFCNTRYADNKVTLKVIEEFHREYYHHTPIWWYTRDIFVYRMLNHALRISEAEVLIYMAFFIKDLHQQIEQLHSSTLSNNPVILYRGQNMIKEEFEKLKQNGGGLLSFNSFLSTTKDRTLAYGYAFAATGDPEMIGVLFEMTIDSKIKSSPFASLDSVSYFQGNQSEKEILFSMCTIFRIRQMKQLVTGVWQVDLQLTNEDEDPELNQLIQFIRNEIGELPAVLRLGHLMYYMGEWEQAQGFFTTLAEIFSHKKNIVAVMHSNVGQILGLKGDFNGALLHQQCALQITRTLPISEQSKLHTIFNNIGDTYIRKAEIQAMKGNQNPQDLIHALMQALQHFQTALDLSLKRSDVDLKSIATYHNNIGGALDLLRRHDEALESFNQCLQIELNILPPTHFSLATTYNNIGSISFHLKDYDTALLNYQKCLAIQRRSLPSKHPLISDTCCNIAMVYDAQSNYTEATKYIKEAVDIGSHCFSPSDRKFQLYHMTYLQISKRSRDF